MATKTCKACAHCKRLYVKDNYGFWGSKLYYCALRKETTEPSCGCENSTPKKAEYDLSAERFDRAENDIQQISEALKNL